MYTKEKIKGKRMDKFSNKDLQELTGVSARQAIYLAEKGIVVPECGDATGRGSTRLYSRRNVAQLLLVQALRRAGLDFPALRVVAALAYGFLDELDRILVPSTPPTAPILLNIVDGKYGYFLVKDGKAKSAVFEILDSGKLKLATKEPEAIRADAVVCIEVNLNAALGTMKDIKKPDDEENP